VGEEKKSMISFKSLSALGLDLLFPRHCCSCGAGLSAMEENGLCWDCRAASLPVVPPWCACCGAVVAGRVDHEFFCMRCAEDQPGYDQARSLFRYEGGVRDAIHALKYRRNFSVVPDLARLIAAGLLTYFPELPEDAVFSAVPLHPRKERHRGFNQGRELLRGLRAIRPGTRIWEGLRRTRDTETQTHLSATARRDNVRGAFAIHTTKTLPSTVLLVDDVMTTGATLDACARVLRKGGVSHIYALTLARG
jgi:ComF family protein